MTPSPSAHRILRRTTLRRIGGLAVAVMTVIGLVGVAPAASADAAADALAELNANTQLRSAVIDDLVQKSHYTRDPNADVTAQEAPTVKILQAYKYGITRLDGIQALTGLTDFDLHQNFSDSTVADPSCVSDISQLAGLTSLTSVYLPNCGITNIDALSTLPNLASLDLSGNHISDISPLAGLGSLEYLELSGNHLSDLSPLAGLSKLTWLYLLNTGISDISALKGLKNLGSLDLSDNNISNISALSAMSDLYSLSLSRNQVSDISVLNNMGTLESLTASNNQISDISALRNMIDPVFVDLANNRISDISPLAGKMLFYVSLNNQSVQLGGAATGAFIADPITAMDGTKIAVASTSAGFVPSSTSATWSFTTPGAKTLSWSVSAPVFQILGTDQGSQTFSGTITMTVANPSISDTPASPAPVPDRLSGPNRYATAQAVAEQFGTANAVVVANGADAKGGADALAANYLAGRVGAPILLTEAKAVPAATLAAVKQVLQGSADPTIYVMGGTDSVSDSAANAIKAAAASVATGTVTIVRVAGSNRFDTSALASEKIGAPQPVAIAKAGTPAKTAILASGTSNADALSAAPISYAMGIPVLLTDGTTLDPAVKEAIKKLGITQLIVLGGPDRVTPATVAATGIAAKDVIRISGANRYATSAALYTWAMGQAEDDSGEHYGAVGPAYLANGGAGFADALTIGPLAGRSGSPLLTVTGGSSLPPQIVAFLTKWGPAFDTVTAVGGPDRVSATEVTQATGLIG